MTNKDDNNNRGSGGHGGCSGSGGSGNANGYCGSSNSNSSGNSGGSNNSDKPVESQGEREAAKSLPLEDQHQCRQTVLERTALVTIACLTHNIGRILQRTGDHRSASILRAEWLRQFTKNTALTDLTLFPGETPAPSEVYNV